MCVLGLLCGAYSHAFADGTLPSSPPGVQPAAVAHQPATPPPTLRDVPYGEHERQVLDFWKAARTTPTPLVFYIHGGGWTKNDKTHIELPRGVSPYLAAGISVVSINYRYLTQTRVTEMQPRIKVPLYDAARALQFVRSKAAEWNINPRRIGVSGNSAGACSALWLAFHPDLADPASPDPIARLSTRPWCAGVQEAQTTLDPKQMKEWTPNSKYGGHAFGFAWDPKDPYAEFKDFLAHRERVLPWIQEFSPYALATSDARPIYLFYGHDAPALGQDKSDPTHTANFGLKLQEKLRSLGVECEFVYPGAPGVRHLDVTAYYIDELK